ncbi:MAG: rod shape-determining protein [Clostridia bacterium]|nr:rod shape-determining protein [Clostridia bacterium]
MGLFKQNVAIDLGTSTVLVCVGKKGVVLKEPSIVAVKSNTRNIVAIGEDARQMIGRTPDDVTTVKPIQNGVISSFTITKKMIQYFINKALANPLKRIFLPDVIICVPSKTTNVERRAVEQAAQDAGAHRVFLVEEPLAAAVGAGLDISRPSGHMIVDVGGGTTDIAVISFDGIVTSKSVKVGGNDFDETIKNYLKRSRNLMVGDTTAEYVKIEAGCLYEGVRNDSVEVHGSNILTGLPSEHIVTSQELAEPLVSTALPVLDGIRAVLEETPPELAADIYTKGILMTGGGSLLAGFDELIHKTTGVEAFVADEPQYCVARGSIEILNRMSKNKKDAYGIKR